MSDIQLVANTDTGFLHRPLWDFPPLLALYKGHYKQPAVAVQLQKKKGRK